MVAFSKARAGVAVAPGCARLAATLQDKFDDVVRGMLDHRSITLRPCRAPKGNQGPEGP